MRMLHIMPADHNAFPCEAPQGLSPPSPSFNGIEGNHLRPIFSDKVTLTSRSVPRL